MENQYDLSGYVDRLYSAAVKKARDTYIAEDITQETLLAACSQLARGKQPHNLWAWLLTILSNKYCDWLREKYNRPQVSFEEYPFEIAEENKPQEDSAKMLEAVLRELGYLARIHREVMVLFYLHSHSVDQIAEELGIPSGTVKSRLSIGRQHIRKGVNSMENHTKQSYEPDILQIACSGKEGLRREPFSLVPSSDRLAQSILIQAYQKPLTEVELARSLGVPAAFVEPVVEKLTQGELMQRTHGGKVYTDFILFTYKDRKATFEKQLSTVETHFQLFWEETSKALEELREKPWCLRQSQHARAKLELYFCLKLLANVQASVREHCVGSLPYSEYPYRKDGGRWIALGMLFSGEISSQPDDTFWKYSVNGEMGYTEKNFRDTKYLELRSYGTSLGKWPDYEAVPSYVKWFYELWEKVPSGEWVSDPHILQDTDSLTLQGFLKQEKELELDIPAISLTEYGELCGLASAYVPKVTSRVQEVLLPLFESGYVRLPSHLKSVPKGQQYMFCCSSIPMAVILQAKEKGLLLKGVDYPVPAALLILEKN